MIQCQRVCFHCGWPKGDHQKNTLHCPDELPETWRKSSWYSTKKELYFVVLVGRKREGVPLPLSESDMVPDWLGEDALALFASEESALRAAKEMFPYLEAEVYPWRHYAYRVHR